MKDRKYCVYNQTSECFLSLGVMLYSYTTAVGSDHTPTIEEENWLIRRKDHRAFVVSASCDLVYLDKSLRTVQVVESFPMLRIVHWRDGAASVLAVPIHTIYSSQTQAGHKLLISGAAEMELHLRRNSHIGASVDNNSGAPEITIFPTLIRM